MVSKVVLTVVLVVLVVLLVLLVFLVLLVVLVVFTVLYYCYIYLLFILLRTGSINSRSPNGKIEKEHKPNIHKKMQCIFQGSHRVQCQNLFKAVDMIYYFATSIFSL